MAFFLIDRFFIDCLFLTNKCGKPIKHAWCLNEDHMLEGLSSHPSTLRLHLARLSFLAKNIRQMARELCDDSPGVITTSNQPAMIAYTILNDLK
jgi:hypothetical protein